MPTGLRTLIAVVTCHSTDYSGGYKNKRESGQLNRAQVVRDTWLPSALAAGLEVKFFYGSSNKTLPGFRTVEDAKFEKSSPDNDIVVLPAPDDYAGLTKKVWSMVRWAYDHGYDALFKTDDDCYLNAVNFAKWEPTGDYVGNKHCASLKDDGVSVTTVYASGAGYWLSRRAMEVILANPVPTDWAEDRQVGMVLLDNGIELTDEQNIVVCACPDCESKFKEDFLVLHTAPFINRMYELEKGATAH